MASPMARGRSVTRVGDVVDACVSLAAEHLQERAMTATTVIVVGAIVFGAALAVAVAVLFVKQARK